MAVNGVTTTLTPSNATDAAFRAWGSAISAKFAESGWIQTADTGQINWTTVLIGAVVNTAVGYEIWTMADSLQATAPIYLKLEFGTGNPVSQISMWHTYGTGSNGLGVLTGPITTRQQLATTGYTTNPLSCYWSGSTSHFTAALFTTPGVGASTANCGFLSIERTKDSLGADTSTGLLIIAKSTTQMFQTYWNRTIGTPAGGGETSLGAMGNTLNTGKNGTQVAVYPIFLNNAGIFVNPPLGILSYFSVDLVANSAVSFTMYGATHTYMPQSSTSFALGSNVLSRSSANQCIMTRYE